MEGCDVRCSSSLLAAPLGWTVTRDTLTEFVDATAYDLDFAASEKAAFAEFTLEDLLNTPAGDVWMDGHSVSRDEFNQTAGCIH